MSSSPPVSGASLLVACLKHLGVSTIFGLPGEENSAVVMAVADSTLSLVSVYHEAEASFMAAMHGHLTGRPGVCLSTLGPGATNLLTGVAQATLDHAPLVAIIGQAATGELHKQRHQNIDTLALYRPVAKWVARVPHPDYLPEILFKAFRLAITGTPGSVVIELPEDVAAAATEARPLPHACYPRSAGATQEELAELTALLEKSHRPLLLIGDGAIRTPCAPLIAALLHKSGLYVVHTFMGKGAVPPAYERDLRCVGLGMHDVVLEAFEEADLIITLGYATIEYPAVRWCRGRKKQIVHLHETAAEVDAHYLPVLEVVGSLPAILQAWNAMLQPHHFKARSYFKRVKERVDAALQEGAASASFPLTPRHILQEVQGVMGAEDILISDVGAHKIWIGRHYFPSRPKTCFISNGFCAMGCAIPYAIEAKRLYPTRRVLVICGDGGLMMSAAALATAVRLRCPIVVLVWCDGAYGLIQWKQEIAYGRSHYVRLHAPDLVGVAAAYGCHAQAIKHADALAPALEAAFECHDRPTLLAVPVDYKENMRLFRHLEHPDLPT